MYKESAEQTCLLNAKEKQEYTTVILAVGGFTVA